MSKLKPYWAFCFAVYVIFIAATTLVGLTFKGMEAIEWVLLLLGGVLLILKV